ncbi:hypothetical protein J437_LFUL017039 [Ladona fulva]|uniref:Integrase catalytic domain-containing protein n=1 Tax=Ladona fulva TaxID=123851 RepID=A0A8K0KNE1_LADFU|nr:hypothetical protein J437_LFUL017039 [Ladona fulva]
MKDSDGFLGIKKLQTTAYHPPCNGLVVRSHQILEDIISHFVQDNQRDWDTRVPYALLDTTHSSTGKTAYFLLYRQVVELPFDDILTTLRQDCSVDDNYATKLRLWLNVAFDRVQSQLNLSAESQEVSYQLRDKFYLQDPIPHSGVSKNFAKRWKGPCRIIGRRGEVSFEVQHLFDARYQQWVHTNQMKPY